MRGFGWRHVGGLGVAFFVLAVLRFLLGNGVLWHLAGGAWR